MNQIIAIALGGASGAIIRFLMSHGLYQWLGRDFPYGTLIVNIVGSFMIGLLTESLTVHRLAITLEYRSAILVGFIGALTTFSTFSLETFYLIQQGNIIKAALNIIISVFACLFAVWTGLLCAKALHYSNGVFYYSNGIIAYASIVINTICAFILAFIASLILQKISLVDEYKATAIVVMIGGYLTLSGLYVILFLLEQGLSFKQHINAMLLNFSANSILCLFFIWLALMITKKL